MPTKGPCPLKAVSTEPICPRPSLLPGVVDQSQTSVGRDGTNRVHCLTYVTKNGLVETGLKGRTIG